MLPTSLTLENPQIILGYASKQSKPCSYNKYGFNIPNNYDEIYIQGIKNKKLLDQIKKFFKFDILLNSSGKITRYEISNLLYKMKTSGFFTKLKLISVKIHKKQKIIIYVSPNITFSKIEVLNNNKKIVPYKYINQLFKHQIGYPQSLYQLNTALHKLTTWYHVQGYYYTITQIIRNDDNPEHIILNISEGIIDKIDFIFMPPYQNVLLTTANIYIILVQRLLGISKKNILNTKYLDFNIQCLKEQEILKNCSYRIEYIGKKRDHLAIKIYLFFHPYKTLNLLFEQSCHPCSTKKIGKQLIKYYSTQYFYNYYNKYAFYNSLKYSNIYPNLKLKQLFHIPIYTTYQQKKTLPNFTSNGQDLSHLINYYTGNVLTLPKSIWQIHRYIISPTYFNYSINLKLFRQNLISEIRCTKPWININTNTIGIIYCYILKSIFMYSKVENKDLNLLKHNFLQYSSYFINFHRIEIGLIYKLAKKILIKQLLGKYKIFYNYLAPQTYLKNSPCIDSIKKNTIAKIIAFSEIIKQNYIYLKCEYKYNTEDKLEKTPKGWSAAAQHITCIQVSQNINTIFNNIHINHTHLIQSKNLYHYQVLRSHNLINKIEFIIILGHNIINPLVKSINNTNDILDLNNFFQLTERTRKFWTVTSEYHYMFDNTYSGFIFLNYGQNNKNKVYSYGPNLLHNTITTVNIDNQRSLYCGLGIQIKNSIMQTDLMRLEFSIDKYINSQFYIKILGW